MFALSRFGPAVVRSALQQPRHMSTAKLPDPVQKLFVDKIREFKASNKGLDEAHQKAMIEEMSRLKRIYNVEDEGKLAQLDYKFPNEVNVSLHDLDENKETREQISSGEYQKQLAAQPTPQSALLASIPEQVQQELHLPPLNKPNPLIICENHGVPLPPVTVASKPDYEYTGGPITSHELERKLHVKFGPNMPTIHDDKKPERDIVNFPRQYIRDTPPPTRFHFIPESWFQFFYPKTGVTGPYIFAFSFGSFLFSKEWLVMEHELLTGFSSIAIFTIAVIKYGPTISTFIRNNLKKQCDDWEIWRKGNIEMLDQMEKHYTNEIKKSDTIKELYDIRKQDIDIQLECEYRQRLKTAYDDTKRRLNYLVSVADSQRQIAHRNMVNWVISNAAASFGQKQEADVLDNCISNLKQLSSQNANVI